MTRISVTADSSGTMRGGAIFAHNIDPDVNTVAAFMPDRVAGWIETTNEYLVEVFLDSGHTIAVKFVGDSIDARYEALDEFREVLMNRSKDDQ